MPAAPWNRATIIFLNETKAQFRAPSHQFFHPFTGEGTVFRRQHHAQQGAFLRVHGGFLKRCGRHFAKAFEAADFDLLVRFEARFQHTLPIRIIHRIDGNAARLQAIKRWLRQKHAALPHQFWQFAIEESQQKCCDMRAIHIRIGHDDNAPIAQPRDVKPITNATPKGFDQILQFLILAQLFHTGAGDIQDLAAKGQHGLGFAVPCLFGGTAGGIALHQEKLRAIGAFARAIGKLAGQAELTRRGLARRVFLRAAAQPVLGAFNGEGEEIIRRRWIARQPMIEMIAQGQFHEARSFRAGQPVLGLGKLNSPKLPGALNGRQAGWNAAMGF